MLGLVNFSLLAVLTMFAVAAAAALCWMSLRITILLIEPATARRVPYSTELADGQGDWPALGKSLGARAESRGRGVTPWLH